MSGTSEALPARHSCAIRLTRKGSTALWIDDARIGIARLVWEKQARIQGAVVLEAVISKQGTIVNLKVISGHPWLILAALDAVRHWKYKPTLLNDEPVEVVTNITVNFSLDG